MGVSLRAACTWRKQECWASAELTLKLSQSLRVRVVMIVSFSSRVRCCGMRAGQFDQYTERLQSIGPRGPATGGPAQSQVSLSLLAWNESPRLAATECSERLIMCRVVIRHVPGRRSTCVMRAEHLKPGVSRNDEHATPATTSHDKCARRHSELPCARLC